MIVSSITVVDRPQARGHPLRERVRGINSGRRGRVVIAGAAGLVTAAAIIVALLGGRSAGPAEGHGAPELKPSERAAIATALGYPYPPGCLRIAVSDHDPDYATVHINRTLGCARYRGYINSSLHRTDGRWRLVLDEGQLFVPNRLLGPSPSPR